MIMRIMIRDPFSSLPISNSLIASASASDEDTSPSTSGGGGGDPPAWANDSASASVTLTLSSAPSTISQSTFTHLYPLGLSPQPVHAVAMHTQRRRPPYTLSPCTIHAVALREPSVIRGPPHHRRGKHRRWRCVQFASFMQRRAHAGSALSASSGVAVIVPVQVSSTNPAQVSSTSSAGSIVPTGFASISSSLSHNSRKGAIAGGIVGSISIREEAGGTRRGRGGDAGEKPDGVVGPKDDKAQTEIATPIPPTTSDSTAGSPLPNSNVPSIPQTEIATPIPPTTSDPTASWKYYIIALPEMPLMSSKVVFAVDASDSTAGPIMQRQQEFVLAMVEDYQLPHSVIMWGSSVEQPKSAAQISWDRHRDWGTSPEVIFADAAITEELKSCNMWYLLTDGEVDSPVNFAGKALENGMANTPVVFVITGTKLTSTTDISVGLPVFASAPDAAIVFKNAASGEIYVVAAKGAFEVVMAGYKINLANLNWKSLPFFPTESAFKNALEGINIMDTARLKTGGAIYLGRAWHEKHQCFVRIDRLLEQMPPQSIPENELLDLLEDETFKALALSCKTRGLVQNLRDWLLAKKEQPRDMPAIHRPHLENSPLLPRISRCLEKLTALENTGFDVGILEWSSHRSMSAAEAVSSPKVDQEPEVLKAHSSTSTTGAHLSDKRRKHPRQKRGKSAEVPTPVTPEELSSPKTRTSGSVKALQHPQISESTANTSRALLRTVFHRAHHPQEHCVEASASKIPDCGLHLDEYKRPFKCHWMNPYPYEGNSCHWEVDDKWGQLLDEFDRAQTATENEGR
ncbi:hypothetical protein B0H13DRAFT_1871208 [Mycena leptocephala]|nr:hypothetical protein B0H13DRAFT_1871208 [Mycena leptocephala]